MFANSSRSVSAIDAKLGLITGRCTGNVIRGYAEGDLLRPRRAPHRFPVTKIDAMVCAFMDGECAILVLCCTCV